MRAAASCFGHRLCMDRIVPGGVSVDPSAANLAALRAFLATVSGDFEPLVRVYDNMASLQDRTVTTGIVRPELVRRFGAGGHVGRASGRAFDARKTVGYAPYNTIDFPIPTLDAGDVNARVWIRVEEIRTSLGLLDRILGDLPAGPVSVPIPPGSGEGISLTEAFRGDVLIWLRLRDGLVEHCHARDASWFQWPLLEAAIEGNIVADFPLCNKSFNCSYSGHDL